MVTAIAVSPVRILYLNFTSDSAVAVPLSRPMQVSQNRIFRIKTYWLIPCSKEIAASN